MIHSEAAAIRLNKAIKLLINQGLITENIGIAEIPIPLKIESISSHAAKRMHERGITKDELVSAYPSEFFDDGIKRVIEEVKKYDTSN